MNCVKPTKSRVKTGTEADIIFASKVELGKRQPLFDAISTVADGFIDNRDVDTEKTLVYYSAGSYLFDRFMRTDHPLAKELDKYALFCDVMVRFNSRYIWREADRELMPLFDYGFKEICMQEIATNANQAQVEALCYGIDLLLDERNL